MKVIVDVRDACSCQVKRTRFLAERQQSGFADLGIGSVIECDCGIQYVLQEAEGGRRWIAPGLPTALAVKRA